MALRPSLCVHMKSSVTNTVSSSLQCFSIMCLWTPQASNSPVVLFQRTRLLFWVFDLLCKKSVMLDDKCGVKIHFLFITDLLGLSVSSREKPVCTCEDHPESPTSTNFSGIGFFLHCFKIQWKISLKYDTIYYITIISHTMHCCCKTLTASTKRCMRLRIEYFRLNKHLPPPIALHDDRPVKLWISLHVIAMCLGL